jgi:hypothetical protein
MKTKNDKTTGIPYEDVYSTYLKHNPNGSVPSYCLQQEDGSWEVMNNSQDNQCLAVIEVDGTVRPTSFGEIGPTKLVRVRVWQKIESSVSQEVTIQVPHSATRKELESLQLSDSDEFVPEPELTTKQGSYFEVESVEVTETELLRVANTGDPVDAKFQRDETGKLIVVAEKEE